MKVIKNDFDFSLNEKLEIIQNIILNYYIALGNDFK